MSVLNILTAKHNLFTVNLDTGTTTHVKLHKFICSGSWCECPNQRLFVSGGFRDQNYEVLTDTSALDLCRDYAVTRKCKMMSRRMFHALAYFEGHVYAIGGEDTFANLISGSHFDSLRHCERFSLATEQWELIPALPVGYSFGTSVVREAFLYVFKSVHEAQSTTIQVLNLVSLSWRVLSLSCPIYGSYLTSFTLNRELFVLVDNRLYRLQDNKLEFVVSTRAVCCKLCRPYKGKLYYFRFPKSITCEQVQL
jgi:hypothetical protein